MSIIQNLNTAFKKNPLLGKLVIAGLLIGIALLTGLLAFAGGRSVTLAFSNPGGRAGGPEIGAVDAQGTPLADSANAAAANPNAPSDVPELTPWDGVGRVTMLLIGLDYRDWSAGTDYSRSDTMMLLTLDPLTKTAGMLSIPRDMWVAIPGFQHGKINTAYYLGEAYKLPGGGPGLAVKTVEEFLGVPINYYAQVDFGAFVRFIDELGGVKINVPEKIVIDLLGKGSATKKTLQPGVQVLPGEWTLAYARNRYTSGGDFDRGTRQQQVIMAVRDRILSLELLPGLISRAPALYSELASGVHTNLTLDQIIKLAVLAMDVPDGSIQQGALDEEYVLFGTSPDGLSIVIPLPDKIFTLVDQLFTTSGSLSPQTPGDSLARMQAEAASVALYNGSSRNGLAESTAELLRQQGMNVSQIGSADQPYPRTTLVDHTGSPASLRYLAEALGLGNEPRLILDYNPSAAASVEVYLGEDWAQRAP
ncbi:MAG TPA: LCP family protein [Anaerolineales bacterium]|nr:LCP family protein [Anaerolineales bacterium]